MKYISINEKLLENFFSIHKFVWLLKQKYDKDIINYSYGKLCLMNYDDISNTHYKTDYWTYVPKEWIDENRNPLHYEVSKTEEEEYNKSLIIKEERIFEKYWLKVSDIKQTNLNKEQKTYDIELKIEYLFEITSNDYKNFISKIEEAFLNQIEKSKYTFEKLEKLLLDKFSELDSIYWKIEIVLEKLSKEIKISKKQLYSLVVLLCLKEKIKIKSIQYNNNITIKSIRKTISEDIGCLNNDLFFSGITNWIKIICYTNWNFEIWDYKSNIRDENTNSKNWIILFFTILQKWLNKKINDYLWDYTINRRSFTLRKDRSISSTTFRDIPARFNNFAKKHNINLRISNDNYEWINITKNNP